MEPVVTLDGIELNSDDNGFGFKLDVDWFEGWYGSPTLRSSYTDRPFADGSYFGPPYSDVRVVTFTGDLVQPDLRSLITANGRLAGICRDPNKLYELRVTDDAGSLFALVQRSSPVDPKYLDDKASSFSFSVTAPDPRKFDVNEQHPVTAMAQSSGSGIRWRGTDGSGGIRWRGADGLGGILWRGTDGSDIQSGTILLDNTLGTAEADITFTVTGPAQIPSISTTDQWITYNGNLGASDVLVINTGSGSVLLNGVNRRSNLSRAQFFQVPAESSLEVRFTADVQSADARLAASFRTSYA